MRLINTSTYELHEFFDNVPRYAILSHTWNGGEVTFQDIQSLPSARLKPGFAKIQGTCKQALKDKLEYCWVDTCCIDKASSAELSEAINSMFTWYQNAAVCYAYLVDVTTSEQLSSSNWFLRGWTLQELLAPKNMVFYTVAWDKIGTKEDAHLCEAISTASGIETEYLENKTPTWRANIAKRMSWASKRVTTRTEDLAYCLLGIFEIHMPLLYGEGSQSFVRLQEEIIRQSNDETIFCWSWKSALVPSDWGSILAPCAAVFEDSSNFHTYANSDFGVLEPYNITNAGLSIRLPLVRTSSHDLVLALLQVSDSRSQDLEYESHMPWRQYCIPLQSEMHERIFKRYPFPEAPFQVLGAAMSDTKDLLIQCKKRGVGIFRDQDISPWSIRQSFEEPWLRAADFGIFLIGRNQEKAYKAVSNGLRLPFKTDNVLHDISENLLIFSFSETHDAKSIGIAIVRASLLDELGKALCLAVRKITSVDGTIEHRSYCKVVTLVRMDFGEVSKQVKEEFSKNEHGITFAGCSSFSLLLENKILYSSVCGLVKNLQLAYVAFKDTDHELLREMKDIVYPPWHRRGSFEEGMSDFFD